MQPQSQAHQAQQARQMQAMTGQREALLVRQLGRRERQREASMRDVRKSFEGRSRARQSGHDVDAEARRAVSVLRLDRRPSEGVACR